jgi:hypothetical protein
VASDASVSSIETLLAPVTPDAGPVMVDSSHALTVTTCSSSKRPCSAPGADASTAASYLVVFGSGRGEVRSRGQAVTELYEELRNRLTSGERIDVEPRSPGAPAPVRGERVAEADA